MSALDNTPPAQRALLAANALYALILKDGVREPILDGFSSIISKHPKIPAMKRIGLLAMIGIAKAGQVIDKLISAHGMLNMCKKYWKYRKVVTSRMVPHPDCINSTEDLADYTHIFINMLHVVVSNFSKEEVNTFYDLVGTIITFAERTARAERWPTDLYDFSSDSSIKWVPLEDVIDQYNPKSTKSNKKAKPNGRDHGGKGGSSGCTGGGVPADQEGQEAGEGDAGASATAPPSTDKRRRRGRPRQQAQQSDHGC